MIIIVLCRTCKRLPFLLALLQLLLLRTATGALRGR